MVHQWLTGGNQSMWYSMAVHPSVAPGGSDPEETYGAGGLRGDHLPPHQAMEEGAGCQGGAAEDPIIPSRAMTSEVRMIISSRSDQ